MKNKYILLRIAAMVAVMFVPLLIGVMNDDIETKQTLCPIMRLFGVPCPGCGLTKSIYFAWCGQPMKSIGYNPMGILIIAICLVLIGLSVTDWIHNTERVTALLDKVWIWKSVVVLYGVYYLVRVVSTLL